MVKRPDGNFELLDEEEKSPAAIGEVIKVNITVMRNGAFFRKWWVLAKFAFDIWCERGAETLEYKGVQVSRSFKVFRKDLIVMSGYFMPVFRADGAMKLEAMSIAWGSMKEPEFQKFYDATVSTILHKILPHAGLTEASVNEAVNELLGFV